MALASWGMVRVSGSCAADRHALRAQRAAAAWEADGGERAAASAGANGVGGELADVVNGARANACDHCAVGGGGADPMYEELNCADSADGGETRVKRVRRARQRAKRWARCYVWRRSGCVRL